MAAKDTALTKSYFDKGLKDIKGHVTKETNRLSGEIADLAGMSAREFRAVHESIHKSQEELARMTAKGFSELQKQLDVREEIEKLKKRMDTIEHAVRI